MRRVALLSALFILECHGFAETIQVPQDFSTIQQAIDYAAHGDTVLVSPGTYLERIHYKGKGIALQSTGGPEVTVIDGSQMGCTVIIDNNETHPSLLEGFTVTGGLNIYFQYGGGITVDSESSRIAGNRIHTNTSDYSGGGIYVGGGSPLIEENWIYSNACENFGGGVHVAGGFPVIEENWIHSNWAQKNGGGLEVRYDSSPIIRNNRILLNATGQGDGGGIMVWICSGTFDPVIEGNLISWNSAFDKGGGLCVYNAEGETFVQNNLFTYNYAFGADATYECRGPGGGIYTEYSHTKIVNNTLCFNYAESHLTSVVASGIGCSGISYTQEPVIKNNIIASNIHGIGILCHLQAAPEISFNDVWGNEGGDYLNCVPGFGDIHEDPLLDLNDPYLHLFSLSPCINRGTHAGAPALDMDGDPRPFMGTVDMGGDEYTGVHLLEADLFEIQEGTVGRVDFALHGGVENMGRTYLLLGSLSGTAPGIPLPGHGANLPLNWDPFTHLVIQLMNTAVLSGFMGTLDGLGEGSASLDTLGPLPPGSAGITLSFAYGLKEPWNVVSNPVQVKVVSF